MATQVASAQFVTNTVTVRNTKGMGVGIVYATPTFSTSYDKPSIRSSDQTTQANKLWIGWDLSAVWAAYGKANLVGASLTIWGENGPTRNFWVAALNDSTNLDNWSPLTLHWTNAPGNTANLTYPGSGTLNQSFDWARCYGGTNLWVVSSGGNALAADLARPDLGGNFDQCARYTSTNSTVNSNLLAWLKSDTDGLVTMMMSGNAMNVWVGTNGLYSNDLALGYTSTNTSNGTFGDVIRDAPTLTLTFVSPAGPASAPVFTNITLSANTVMLRGSNGVPQGAYQMLCSSNIDQPPGAWSGLGVRTFDTNGNFNFTNDLSAGAASFYRLQTLSTGPVYPPEITGHPQSLDRAVGQNAQFNVTASGTDLTYRWFYNTNNLLTSGSSPAYNLNNAQIGDSGKYSVTVSNLLGVLASDFATLTVTGVPPVITVQPTNIGLAVGQAANFSAMAGGTSPLSYQWHYNTNTLLTGQTNSTLTLLNVNTNQAGKYSVTVTNLFGTAQSLYATLMVTNNTQPPFITGQPTNRTVTVGQTANFSVTATGALPLHYQWYYNTNTPLTGETNSTLTLLSVSTNQAGKYSVTITNLYGSTNSTFASLNLSQEQLAFPEAEGYGKYSVGGRGGAVYEVTTLNPTGTGSLGAAISASGPRTVVFRVAGTITGNFTINNNNITIAGQTAPGDGICIKGNLRINAHNVIIRYVRVRSDPTVGAVDALYGEYHTNIIVDHVSTSWSSDETLSLYRNEHITVQWCMITEACGRDNGHRFGGIWGNNYGTYHHNLIAHNESRNPRWAPGTKFNDYRNNVIYNWDYNSCYGGEALEDSDPNLNFFTVNMVANYYKAGPATDSGVQSRIAAPSGNAGGVGSWYVAGNYVNGFPTVTANNWLGISGSSYVQLNSPWPAMPINEQSPADAYAAVLAHGGCSKPNRDSVDTRIMNEVATGTATYGNSGIITLPSDVGGWPTLASGTPPTDTDHDGMPDDWETARSLNPNNAADRNNYTLSPVYTNLEIYLNELGAF